MVLRFDVGSFSFLIPALQAMKFSLILLPFLAISCSDHQVSQIPIIKVRSLGLTQAALKTSIPRAPEAIELSFENLATKVRQHNLSLAAARKLVAEAEGKLRASGLASNPDLEVEFDMNPDFGDFMLTVGVSRKYPRTNRLFIQKRVSQILVQAAQAEVRDAERVLIGEARIALVELVALRDKKTLLAAQEKNASELTSFIEASAVKGEASPLDAGVALLEEGRLGNLTRQIEIKEQLAEARLKPLLGLKPRGRLTVMATLDDPAMPPMNVTSFRRPDLEAFRLRATSAGAETDLARSKRLEDIEAEIFAGVGREEDAPTGMHSEQMLGFRLKIPIGENPSAAGAEAAAVARHERFQIGASALEEVANSEAHAAYAEMKQWQLLAKQMKDRILPLADSQIEKTQSAYERAEVPLQDVLRAREQKLSLETTYLEAVRDFHLAYAKYLTATAQ